MRKIYFIVFIILLNFNFALADKYIGKGPLQLDDQEIGFFLEYYLKFPAGQAPHMYWIAAENGKPIWSARWYCPNAGCTNMRSSKAVDKKWCEDAGEKYYKKQNIKKDVECFIFARRYKIVWDNGNQPQDWKQSLVKKGMSKSELKNKFEELGFYGKTASLNNVTKPKIEEKTNLSDDIISQLKELKELKDSGALTESEFTKAKKKLLEK